MSKLEALPVELFREVASYLKFLDKKALSGASKRCHTMAGHFECPDQLTWLIHLCCSPVKFHGPLFKNPKVFRDLIYNVYGYWALECGTMSALKVDTEDLVSPYFPQAFPESTPIHYYMTVAQAFVRSAIKTSDAAGLDAAPLSPRYYWARIESKTTYFIEWLERQKPSEVYCCKAVSSILFSRTDKCKRLEWLERQKLSEVHYCKAVSPILFSRFDNSKRRT